jgi:hypothetical protein
LRDLAVLSPIETAKTAEKQAPLFNRTDVLRRLAPNAIRPVLLSFEGIAFDGVTRPDVSGAAGLDQYVQAAAMRYQVFDKSNGIYDLTPSNNSQLANLSTRGFVGTGNDVMIGGFILGVGADSQIVVRGIGPSLSGSGINPLLADPTLELYDSNGDLVDMNDNCGSGGPPSATLRIKRSPFPGPGNCPPGGIPPTNPLEACMCDSLAPGAYTAILAGKDGGTGIGLLEIYNMH